MQQADLHLKEDLLPVAKLRSLLHKLYLDLLNVIFELI